MDDGVVVAERDGVVAQVLAGAAGVDEAVAFLDGAEAAAGVPLVDEAERERLERSADGRARRPAEWQSILARRDAETVGYAGLRLPVGGSVGAHGDVAVDRDRGLAGPVLAALLAGLVAVARHHGAGHVQAWVRHATTEDVDRAAGEGFAVDRRLAVLGRRLDDLADTPAPAGVTIRAYRPDVDDTRVVDVLAAAYAGTPEGEWDLAAFRARRGWTWFRPEDLLVAEDAGGGLVGLHWLKRRSARVGEVYNLAIHPDGQRRGLGATLLAAGLHHLRAVGCDEVLLWVDLANERAVRLYTSQGFALRWEDVAFGRDLHTEPPS